LLKGRQRKGLRSGGETRSERRDGKKELKEGFERK